MKGKIVLKILSVVLVYCLSLFITMFAVKSFQDDFDGDKTESSVSLNTEETTSTANSSGNSETQFTEATDIQESENTDESEISTEEATVEENFSNTDLSHPDEFTALLSKAGYDVNALSCGQLVIVESQGNSAVVYFYEKQENGIWQSGGLTVSGWVGSNGVDEKSQEGDYKTPSGLYSIGEAFYIDDEPATGLDTFKVTENTYWVDDPSSEFYNQRVEGTENKDWNSAEHMISYYYSYRYGFVVNFNMNPVVPGRGSAIFFHCGTEPTAGCIAVSESDVLNYLEKLDKNKNPYILLM